MNHKLTFIFLALGALLLAGCMTASFEGDYVVPTGQTVRGNLFVTSGTVTLQEDSRVTGSIFMTSGDLRIGKNAQVGGDVVLTSGSLSMAEGATVHGDVVLSSDDTTVRQSPGATVEGKVSQNIAPYAISLAIKALLLYCVLPLVILIAVILGLGVLLGRSSKRKAQAAAAPASSGTDDPQQKLKQLKAMLDEGVITEKDYEAKKTEILSKM
jgi:cytoskeletal protein CcmA (bactofilin family)/outer membrane murein-binding lipoprotein Lpp